IVAQVFVYGFFTSLQYTSMNTLAYADIGASQTSSASTIASTMQQISFSFGLALASLATSFYLDGRPQSDHDAVTTALHHGFLTLAAITFVSSASFWALRRDDGESVSRGTAQAA
ncbi:MAG TPA: MFS transporter, partial [Rhizobacter sp.]|nr:MFS transporter [Rhizobacter sp.]